MMAFMFKHTQKYRTLFDKNAQYLLFIFIRDNIAYYGYVNPSDTKDIIVNYAYGKGKDFKESDRNIYFFDVEGFRDVYKLCV